MKTIWADIRTETFTGSWTEVSGNTNQEHKHLRQNNNMNNIKYKNVNNVKLNHEFSFNNWTCFLLRDIY